ncbi:hypothetical protein YC2023_015578 [Brassica napus]
MVFALLLVVVVEASRCKFRSIEEKIQFASSRAFFSLSFVGHLLQIYCRHKW